jgi:flagella basal body P-ring formation protein FlgA
MRLALAPCSRRRRHGLGRARQPAKAPQDSSLEQQVKDLAVAGTQHVPPGVTRVDIQVGQLDPRLHLAPCQKVEPYLPSGARLWGKTRIGLRCTQGATPWNVYLPITSSCMASALVATAPLPMGAVVTADDLTQAEVDLAEDASVAVTDTQFAVGRTLARPSTPAKACGKRISRPVNGSRWARRSRCWRSARVSAWRAKARP